MSTREREISADEARNIIDSGAVRSIGLWGGEHWRLSDGRGCVHLRRERGTWYVHRDQWNPGRYPVEHAVEVAMDGAEWLLRRLTSCSRT
jgi:hypothetical protein